MEISEIINKIKSDIECQICFEKFIKLTYKEFNNFLEDNKVLLPQTFEDDYCCRCYEHRFECLKCKNVVCRNCYWNFKNHKFKPNDEDGFAEGCPGEDCPIICPFCRTKDYKIFYGNQIPYELLNEIKNGRCK